MPTRRSKFKTQVVRLRFSPGALRAPETATGWRSLVYSNRSSALADIHSTMKLRLRVSSRLLIEAWTVGFLFVLISISNAWAWGRDGHRIIAEISEQYLEPTTAKQVRDLLALENVTTLADISTWADYIRLQRRD